MVREKALFHIITFHSKSSSIEYEVSDETLINYNYSPATDECPNYYYTAEERHDYY
jgi:hypothetical protein